MVLDGRLWCALSADVSVMHRVKSVCYLWFVESFSCFEPWEVSVFDSNVQTVRVPIHNGL